MRDKIKQYKFQIILFVLLGIFLAITIGHIIQVGWNEFLKEFGNNDKPFSIKNIAIGIAALATAIFTWWKNTISKEQVEVSQVQMREQIKQTGNLIEQTKNAQRQIELQEDIRLDSLFAKAVELLNEKNDLLTRKGGVHILKDLAITSPKHTQKCIDMLCSLNEVWMPSIIKKNINFFSYLFATWTKNPIDQTLLSKNFGLSCENDSILPERISLSSEVIKHMSSIIKIISEDEKFKEVYDLSHKYLCSITIKKVDHLKFIFDNSYLIGANFIDAYIHSVNFKNVHFEHSYFSSTIANNTKLNSCKMDSAVIIDSDFSGSIIHNSSFIESSISSSKFNNIETSCVKFCGVAIRKVSFKGSSINVSDFDCSKIRKADFGGSSFKSSSFNASDISNSQFDGSCFWQTSFAASSLFEIKFMGSILFETDLTSANIVLTGIQLILSDGNLSKTKSVFSKPKTEFEIWLKSRHVNSDSFLKNYREGYTRFHNPKNLDNLKYFNIIKEITQEFIDLRNNISIEDKSIAKGMVYYRESFNDPPEESTVIILKLVSLLVSYIRLQKQEWYDEFLAEGLFKRLIIQKAHYSLP